MKKTKVKKGDRITIIGTALEGKPGTVIATKDRPLIRVRFDDDTIGVLAESFLRREQ